MAAFTATTVAIGGLALAAAGTAFQFIQQRKAAKQQKKAQRAQQRQQDLAARRSRIQAIRETQIRMARARASAGAFGALDTSAFQGGQASLVGQLGAGLGFQTEMSGLSRRISVANQKAADAMSLAGIGAGIAGIGGQVAGFGIRNGGLNGFFNQQKPNPPPYNGFNPYPYGSSMASYN